MAALEILKEQSGEEEWSLKKAVGWILASYVEQAWEDTPVELAVRAFFKWKKDGGSKTKYLNKQS